MDNNLDFKELLNIADYNKVEAKDEASVKRYSTVLPPPKKMKKNGVQSDGVKRFLEKKKAEEAAKAAEARKLKEKLLELRSQNSKNNKKAKIMASRTKDNDFSKIRLTEDEVISKKKIEQELQRKHLKDKVERMKCRIELEEKEKLLPKKRKRKSKHGEEEIIHQPVIEEEPPEKSKKFKNRDRNSEHKPQRQQPPPMSFHELLKVAQVKQYEPVEIPVQKKTEERLLTKKERRIFVQEQELLRRKQERMLQDELEFKSSKSSKHSSNSNDKNLLTEKSKNPVVIHVGKDSPNQRRDETQKFKIPKSSASLDKNMTIPKIDKTKSSSDKLPKASSSSGHKLPIQNGSKPSQFASSTKPQIMKQNTNHDREKTLKNSFPNGRHLVAKEHSNDREKTLKNGMPNGKHPITKERSVDREKQLKNGIPNGKHPVAKGQSVQDREKLPKHSLSSDKHLDSKQHTNHDRDRPSKSSVEVQKPSQKAIVKNGDKSVFKKPLFAEKTAPKKNGVKIVPAVPTVSTDHLKEMEKRIRENLEKEMEERILAKLASLQPPKPPTPPPPPPKPVQNKPAEKVKPVNGTHSALNGKILGKPTSVAPRRDGDRPLKPPVASQKRLGPPPPPKPKPFHPNPYLEPPRRRLEPQRPQKPMKRRIESDDEDDDEDDMSDFIDDGPSQNDEDYSKYIKEIFGYDKNKYIDDDDDDIVESSFVEQMKEETRSAKLGFLEDLEEERKLKEMEKKRKMKTKKK
ncbi:hypothetical protein AVEN_262119-1 [Araneus ventricosus]|uniref:Protein SPT2 homolog n=1 Tax=Araneus ventricosus TaxID=182803 RepID=A0A4Y2EAX3_ARAVE|nr:hypothetical protein AVEN_262119-1 [Araneus ventricosus]